jgi:hypothetical protein
LCKCWIDQLGQKNGSQARRSDHNCTPSIERSRRRS